MDICWSSVCNKWHGKVHCLGSFTPQIILAVVCSYCGGLEQLFHSAQLACYVLLVVEAMKQFPGSGLDVSYLTKT